MYFQHLYPFPKSCVENRDVRFVFGASVQAVISGLDTECVKRVKALWNRFSATASELNVVSADNGFQLVIGGAAAGEVRRYFDLLQGLIKPDTHLWIYENPDADYLTDEFLEAGDTCLARAEIAADDDETLQRVRVLRLSTRYAILCRMAMDDPRRASGWDAFYRDVTAAGIDTFYWRQMPDSAMEFLRAGDLKFRWK